MSTYRAVGENRGSLRAVITRADGTVEDLGLVAAHFDNPFKQLWWDVVGKRLSERRIRQANRNATKE